ncbi:MAG TPA: putative zinc-binding protein [Methanobacteriaceae archaeon]|nr:putative zinc-binding protein [Methanobacteriaceae archaeon]
MIQNKIALAACSGMSPNGLISRVAADDIVKESDNIISICMGATSADREGFRGLIKKYPIIAINGCDGECVNKILTQKGVKPKTTINVMELLKEENIAANDVSRLDENGEKCVLAVKRKVKQVME